MKKILALIMAMLLAMNIAGCSTEYEKRELVYTNEMNEKPEYTKAEFPSYEFNDKKELNDIWKDEINRTANELVSFLNAEYDAEWNYNSVEAYAVDLSEAGISFSIGGIYDSNEKCIYIDNTLSNKSPENMTDAEIGFIVHEILHYLKDNNTGTPMFCLSKGEKILGFYFTEGMTNFICEKYFQSKGMNAPVEHYKKNGYASLMYLCRQLEISFPDLISYYCQDNIKSFEKEFNSLAKKHIENGRNMFAIWLSQLDNMYLAEHDVKSGDNSAMTLAMGYLLANTEIVAAITEKSYSDKFIENFEEYDIYYWGKSFTATDDFTQYFKELFYEEIK